MKHFLDLSKTSTRAYLIAGFVTLAGVAIYIVLAGRPDTKTLLLLLAVPCFLGCLALEQAPSLMLGLLVLSLSFSARYRLFGVPFHNGGAELSIAPLDLPLVGLIALAIPRWSREAWTRVKASLGPLWWAIALFLVAHLLSIIVAQDRGLALLEFARLVKMVLLLGVISFYVTSRRALEAIILVLLFATAVQGLLAAAQWLSGGSVGLGFLGEHSFWEWEYEDESVGRAGGTLGHANVLASFLGLVTPLALAYTLSLRRRWPRLLAAGATLLGMLGVFVTFSRAGWVSLPVGMAVALALVIYRRRISLRRLVPVAALGVVAVVAVGALNFHAISLRLSRDWENSVKFRWMTFNTAFNMISAHPLLGVGVNNYEAVAEDYLLPSRGFYSAENAARIVHNILLLYAAEMGAVGLAAFVALLVAIGILAIKVIKSPDAMIYLVGIGAAAGMIALLVHDQVGWGLKYDPIFTAFWFMIGLLVAAYGIGASKEVAVEALPAT